MRRAGSIESWRDASGKVRYRARIYLANKDRIRWPLPEGISEGMAKEMAKGIQEAEDRSGKILADRAARELDAARARGEVVDEETVDEWFDRYLPTVECGENIVIEGAVANAVANRWRALMMAYSMRHRRELGGRRSTAIRAAERRRGDMAEGSAREVEWLRGIEAEKHRARRRERSGMGL